MWSYACPCGRSFSGNTVEAVQEKASRHARKHREQVQRLLTGEPPEGWQPGFNCAPSLSGDGS